MYGCIHCLDRTVPKLSSQSYKINRLNITLSISEYQIWNKKDLHLIQLDRRDKVQIIFKTHLSIVTERSPQAWSPARTKELQEDRSFLPSHSWWFCSTSFDCSTSSLCSDILLKAFKVSMDITRHVIVLGTLGFLFPDLNKIRLQIVYAQDYKQKQFCKVQDNHASSIKHLMNIILTA